MSQYGRTRSRTTVPPFLAAAAAVLLAAPAARAAEFYVDSDRGDDAGGGTRLAPWQSLARAMQAVQPGDTVYLRGTWREPLVVPPGDSTGRIRVQAWPGAEAVIVVPSEALGSQEFGHGWVRLQGYTDLVGVRVQWEGGVATTENETRDMVLVAVSGTENRVAQCTLDGRVDWDLPVDPPADPSNPPAQGAPRCITFSGTDHTLEKTEIRHCFHAVTVSSNAGTLRLLGNVIHDIWRNCFMVQPPTDTSQRAVLIQDNWCSGSVKSDGVQTNSYEADLTYEFNMVIRSNVFDHFGENCIDLKGADRVLVEGNVCRRAAGDNDGWVDGQLLWDQTYDDPGSGSGITHGSGQPSSHVIIRFNVVYANNGGISVLGNLPNPKGWYVYNNTLLGNTYHRYELGSSLSHSDPDTHGYSAGATWRARAFAWVNNIVCGQNDACILVRPGGARQGDVDHNLYYDCPNVAWVTDAVGSVPAGPIQDLASWQAVLAELPDFQGQDAHALWAYPALESGTTRPTGPPDGEDFRPRPDSPTIDAGRPLTHTRSGGTGRVIPVDDAGFFFDGFGIVHGDPVLVGSQGPLWVLRVDEDNDEIEVDRDATWQAGDPVTLPYQGSAPDIGACEYQARTCWYETHANPPDGGVADAGPPDAYVVDGSVRPDIFYPCDVWVGGRPRGTATSGCSCRSARSGAAWWLVLVAFLALAWRRRNHTPSR